jgi:hypothetical protein
MKLQILKWRDNEMACFLVPMGEAIVTTVIQKVVKNKEKEAEAEGFKQTGLTWSRKLSWLNNLLWGGVALLAFEHLWHGEIVLWPPFLTAMKNPADVAPMLHEMETIGAGMAIFVSIIWLVMVLVADSKAKSIPAAAKADA